MLNNNTTTVHKVESAKDKRKYEQIPIMLAATIEGVTLHIISPIGKCSTQYSMTKLIIIIVNLTKDLDMYKISKSYLTANKTVGTRKQR